MRAPRLTRLPRCCYMLLCLYVYTYNNTYDTYIDNITILPNMCMYILHSMYYQLVIVCYQLCICICICICICVEDCVFLPCLPVHCLCTHFVISCGTMQSHSAARASLCMNMVQHADRCSMLPPTTERRLCSHLSGLKRPQGGAPGEGQRGNISLSW